jgi:D-xylose transport system permease protein
MTHTAHAPATQPKRGLIDSLELDTRLLGMIGAFVVLCLVFLSLIHI